MQGLLEPNCRENRDKLPITSLKTHQQRLTKHLEESPITFLPYPIVGKVSNFPHGFDGPLIFFHIDPREEPYAFSLGFAAVIAKIPACMRSNASKKCFVVTRELQPIALWVIFHTTDHLQAGSHDSGCKYCFVGATPM
jgi:hypothetical protein